MGFCGEIGVTAEDDSTEEEWVKDWHKYWAEVDAK
jgi:hypothetical protein